MQYTALALDYDGTLATGGEVSGDTVAALHRWQAAGGVLLLVTGRHLEELVHIFPQLALFARAVVENGALLYTPASGESRLLGEAVPAALVEGMRRQHVQPLFIGRGVVATYRPHDTIGQQVIDELGLNWRVMLNKNDVMLLPHGIDKQSGLRAALAELSIPTEAVVGVGDAENDLDLFAACGLKVAVANALPELQAQADRMTASPNGAGVTELIDTLLAGR